MVTINFMGDILVLNWFGSLEGIAIVTIINVTAGALSGYFFLRKRLKLVLKDFVTGAKSVFSKIKLFIIPGS